MKNNARADGVVVSADGRGLVSQAPTGTRWPPAAPNMVRLWDLDVQYAIQRICATAGGLTPRQWNQYIPQLPYEPACPP